MTSRYLLRLAALMAALSSPAHAAVLCVNPGGTGGCFATIQGAVDAAVTDDTITVAAGTYVENVVVGAGAATRLAIEGVDVGSVVVDGNGSAPVVDVRPDVVISLAEMTLTNGLPGMLISGAVMNVAAVQAINNPGDGIVVGDGGTVLGFGLTSSGNGGVGIRLDRSDMTIRESAIATNAGDATGGGVYSKQSYVTIQGTIIQGNSSTGSGGGISVLGGKMTVIESTIAQNTAAAGGGVAVSGALLVVDRTTVSGNAATADGGGLLVGRRATLVNCTVSGNQAVRGGGIALVAPGSNLKFESTTVAANTATAEGGGIWLGVLARAAVWNSLLGDNGAPFGADCAGIGFLRSQRWNLVEDPTGCELRGSDRDLLLGVDPMLGPLTLNPGGNGLTETHALLAGSPAIDHGNPAANDGRGRHCPVADQRTIPRFFGRCDIGAYEAP